MLATKGMRFPIDVILVGYVTYKGIPTFVKRISTVVESRSD